jgi:hypothetical protein
MLLAVLAVASACVSGLVLGLGRRRAPAAALAVAAITALVIAPTGGDEVRAAPRVLALQAPADSERLRGDAPDAARDNSAEPRDDSAAERAAGLRKPTSRFRGDVSSEPDALVRAYYADLDARRYDVAWARLAPAVQRAFGGFEAWRDGYRSTLGHAVEDLTVEENAVTHTLVASCGDASGQYAVSWRFERAKAVAVTAEALSGTAC